MSVHPVPRNHGTVPSPFLSLSAIVGGFIFLFFAITELLSFLESSHQKTVHLQLGAIDFAGIANGESFPTGTTGSAARGETVSDLPPAPRRRLGGVSTRSVPSADYSSAIPTFRIAILRPFAPTDATDLVESFVEWNKFIPCDTNAWFRSGSTGSAVRYEADLILSISQTFSSHPPVKDVIDRLVDYEMGQLFFDDPSWGSCFGSIHVVEADIPSDVDLYGISSSDQTNPLWVNGPNEHFIRSIRQLQSMETKYDAVFLMEADARPWKRHWLDQVVEETVEKRPFSILGSENHGMVWKNNRNSMPIALRHHLTGNSVFNLTDPFFNRFIEELEAERETFYHAIPYDYRLSQMFYEASRGVKPDFPFRKMKDISGNSAVLPNKVATFRELWRGVVRMGREDSVIKESASIDNFGATNYLPEEVSPSAAVVHGKLVRDNWNKFKHPVSLVLLESSSVGSTSEEFLRALDSASHPFTEVVVMVRGTSFLPNKDSARESTSIPVITRFWAEDSIEEALCNASISNDWFVVVSSANRIASRQILFPISWLSRNAKVPVPVAPFITPGYNYTDERKLILDNELVFRRDLYDSFCKSRTTVIDPDGDLGQSLATKFIGYLDSIGVADTVYDFSEKVLQGHFQNFVDNGDDRFDGGVIQRALQVLAINRSKSQASQYPTTKTTKATQKTTKSSRGTSDGQQNRRALRRPKQRNLMLGLQMEAIQFKPPTNRGIVDAASSRYPGVARFHIYQIARRGGEEYSLLLTCILQGLLEPDELNAFIPDDEMMADTAAFGPRPDDTQDLAHPLLYYNSELMHSREHIGDTLVSQTYESNVDVLTQAFGDLFQRNIFVAVHSSETEDLAIEERFCVRTNVICIDHRDFTYSGDDERIQGIEKVASILRSQIPLFARVDLDIDAAVHRVKLMEDAAITMEEQPQSARDPIFGLLGRQPSPDPKIEDDTSVYIAPEPFHIFQVAKPHTGSTLLNAILQGLFDEEDASYSFLPKRSPGQGDLRFGPYPVGVEEADIAGIALPFIVHEGKLKLSRDHLSDTIVTKTHVVDIDLIEEAFHQHFEQIYYVVANRAEKDIFVDERYCNYPNVLCVDYDDFAYSPDSSSSNEIMEKIQEIKKGMLDKFVFPSDCPMVTERSFDRVKKMEEATEMMASKTFDEVENTFGIHGGHRNRDDKPTRADLGGGVNADEDDASGILPNLVHLFSPYRLQNCDKRYCPYDQAQTVAIASMHRAANQANRASVTLAATAFADEADAVTPDGFLRLDPLYRSTRTEFPDFVSAKQLPFVADIFEALKKHRDFATFDYVIYTNSDIILHERFYDIVALAIDHGHDAFTINRQTISAVGEDGVLFSAQDLDHIFALEGEEHPGSDCFVIRREIFEQIELGSLYLGFPPFANFILFQIEALAENYRVFESNELKATYHLGDDQSWREDDEGSLELYRHQYHHAIEDMLPLWSSFCVFDWRPESCNSAACTQIIKKFRKFAKSNIDGGIATIEKIYNDRSTSTVVSDVQSPAASTNYHNSYERAIPMPPKERSASNKVTFQFLLGVEGTGHHLHRTMYLSSPVGEWLISKGIDRDVVNLSVALWDRANPSDGIWSAPCSNADQHGEWWKAEEGLPEGDVLFSNVVDSLRAVEKHIEETLASDPSFFSHSEQSLVVAVNGGVAGNAKGERRVSPYMSYPMLGGPCRALQFPNIDVLYQACDVAGVQCQHSVVVRDPYRVLRSTSMNRHFASRHVQLTTLASMQHVILSQMMAYPDRLVACWEADTETPKHLGELFGWTDPTAFEDAFNEMFIVPSPITDDDRREITQGDHLKVYMDGMVASNNRIKELCRQQLEINQHAKASTAE